MQVKHTHLCGFKATNDTFISRAKLFRKVGFGSIITFSLLTLAIISPIYIKFSGVEAVSGTANPSTTTLSLNVVDNLLSLDLSPTSSYGTFASSSPASIQVSTNNVSGYTLSIKSNVVDTSDSNAVSNATNLVNTVDSTKVISSISTATSSSAFSTNTNTQYNNKWGYLPSKLNSLANTNYLPSPSYNEATILNTTTCANGITSAGCTTSATDTYTITLGARVDSTLPTGSYEHDFVLIAVGNPINYSITYHANDGADGADTTNMPTPNPQTGNADSNTTSVVLSTNKPRRAGYELKGWCSVVPTVDTTYPDDQNCTGEGAVLYQPGADYGIDQTTVNVVDLYATWWQPNLLKLNEAHATMQQMSPMACYNSVAYSKNNADANHTPYDATSNPNGYHSATLTDNRDGTTRNYNIVKMPDGLCWMTDNLNLGADSEITLTSANTDLADGTTFTLPASDATTFSTSTAQANLNTATILHDITIPDYTVNSQTYSGKKASYYSYAAATADISTYSKTSGAIVTTSICPKGWDLPTDYQYMNLRNIGGYNIDQYHNANASYANYGRNAGDTPYSFTYGGFQKAAIPAGTTLTSSNLNTYFNYGTSYGYYWTARNYNNRYGYSTYVYGSGLNNSTGSYQYKYYKEMIRCVAGNGTATINYDGNGTTEYPVTGTTASQVDVEINSTMTRANGFTRTGWAFNGWNTKADGSGIAIAANVASTTPLSNLGLADGDTITLYAQWKPQARITFNDNCSYDNTGCATTTDTTKQSNWTTAGSNITLGNDTYFTTRTGYMISSWNTARDGSGTSYNTSTSYPVPSTLAAPTEFTLYAMWSPALTIVFNGNGSTSGSTASQLIAKNSSATLRSNSFSKSGYQFAGWMTEESKVTNTVAYRNNATYTVGDINPGDTVTLYAKWAPIYTIKYSKNNDASVQGEMVAANGAALTHTNVYEGYLISNGIYAPNYKKDGYGFAGWSPSPTAIVGGDDPIYGPNESIYAPDYDKYGENNTVTLYPVWIAKDTTDTMQTFSSSRCNSMPQATYSNGTITVPSGSIIALEDERDGNVYTIARLADGKCWMTENLRLDNTVSAATMASGSQGIGGVFTSLPQSVDANWSSNTSNNLYTGLTALTLPQLNTNNTNLGGKNASGTDLISTPGYPINSGTSGQNGPTFSWYSYGNYYSWAAAMANTNSLDYSTASEGANTSICPTGWHLPYGNSSYTGNTAGGFYYLNQQMGKNTSTQGSREWRMFPNNFIYSGRWNGSSAINRGNLGLYWSSSVFVSSSAYYLRFDSSNVAPGTSDGYKDSGFSVRCVAGGAYTIVYDGNGATAGSMTANGVEIKHTGIHEGDKVDLYSPNYKKDGYGFVGWSPSPTATVGGSAPIYGPNETITAPSYETYRSAPHQVTLYAIWMAKDTTDTMQTFNSSNRCSSMPQATYSNGTITVPSGSIIALEDERDNNVYTVARLADGQCWMVENLRLDNEATISTSNTHNPLNTNGTVNLKIDYANNTIADHLASTNDTWCNSYGASCFDQTMLNTNNTNLGGKNASGTDLISTPGYPINSGTSGQQGSTFSWYSYGNYYNWYSATAGNGTYSKTSGNVDGDLCPTGWHLPYGASTNTGNTAGGFYYLNTKMANDTSTQGSKDWRSFPNNFIYSGVWSDSSAYDRGGYGLYWSSSAYNSTAADYLVLGSSYVDPGTSVDDKLVGYTVRCVAGGSGS